MFNLACPCKFDHGDFSSFLYLLKRYTIGLTGHLCLRPTGAAFAILAMFQSKHLSFRIIEIILLGGIGTPCPCCPSHAQACAPRSGSQGGGFDDCERDSNNDGDDDDDDIGNNDGSADGEGKDKGYPTHTQMCPPSSGS